jgi:hypothetical protein
MYIITRTISSGVLYWNDTPGCDDPWVSTSMSFYKLDSQLEFAIKEAREFTSYNSLKGEIKIMSLMIYDFQ